MKQAQRQHSSYKDLFPYVKPYRLVLFIALLGGAIDAAMQGAFTALLSPILDQGFSNQDPQWVSLIPFLVIGLFVVRAIGNFTAAYGFTWVGRKVVNDLRKQVFFHYLALPQNFYDDNSSGSLINRISYDIEQVANGVSKNLVQMVRDLLSVFIFLGVMFYYSAKLAVIALLVFPLVALIIRIISKRFRRIGHGIQDSMAKITQVVEEVVRGQKIVKIFQAQNDEKARFAQHLKTNRQLQVKITATQESSSSLILLIVAVALAVIMYSAAKSNMSAGNFTAFMTSMLALMPLVKRLSQQFSAIQTTLAAADSVFYVLSQQPEQDDGELSFDEPSISVEFRQVSFTYPKQATAEQPPQALNNINLKVPAGKTVALVGASGSGKSTLANLLPRFYQVNEGDVLLNNTNINQFKLSELRQQIAFVSQETVLFNDSIRNNIAYGSNKKHSESALIKAAEQAHVMEFVEQLPDGLDTMLGDNGVGLSGGQRQRVAIARAILKNAPLLILDEATSALDNKSEQFIQQSLQQIMQHKTTLVIAHRLSTIEHADQVVVLQQGQIVEQGTHQQLLAQQGVYAELYQKQQFSG